MAVPLLGLKFRELDSDANPLAGGKLFAYEAGTTTPKDTYTNADGNVANTNPIILDSQGYADVWLGTGSYKFVLQNANGVELYSEDNYPGDIAGGFAGTVIEISTDSNIVSSYRNAYIVVTGTTNLSLLSASVAGDGFAMVFQNNGSGLVTLDPSGSQTINGSATLVLRPGEGVLAVSDGTNWFATFQGKTPAIQVNAQTGNYTVLSSDASKLVAVDATGGNRTMTLPAAVTAGNGFIVYFKKTDSSANTVTIDPNGSETIDGAATYVMSDQNQVVAITTNGTAWYSFAFSAPSATQTKQGIIEIATNTEALAGSDTTRAVTSAGLASAKTLSSTGYMKLPGGLIMQWGKVSIDPEPDTVTTSFATTFPTSVYSVSIGTQRASGTYDNGNFAQIYGAPTTSGFTVINQQVTAGNEAITCNYVAFGI